jgi:hypothetical protein
MQFVIQTTRGRELYHPGRHSREDLKSAFKYLRNHGAGSHNMVLGAIYRDLFPRLFDKFKDGYKPPITQ